MVAPTHCRLQGRTCSVPAGGIQILSGAQIIPASSSYKIILLTTIQEQCNIFAVQEHHVYGTKTGTVPQQVLMRGDH